MLNRPGGRGRELELIIFFNDWSPDVIPALCVCFHAAAELRSELATDTSGENPQKNVKRRRRQKKGGE